MRTMIYVFNIVSSVCVLAAMSVMMFLPELKKQEVPNNPIASAPLKTYLYPGWWRLTSEDNTVIIKYVESKTELASTVKKAEFLGVTLEEASSEVCKPMLKRLPRHLFGTDP